MTNTANFPQAPIISNAIVVAADDLTSIPPNTVLLLTAGPDGAEISKITAMPRESVIDTGLHLFVSKDNGVTQVLINSALMETHVIDPATAVPLTDFLYTLEDTLVLDADGELYVGAAIALAAGIVFTGQQVNLGPEPVAP